MQRDYKQNLCGIKMYLTALKMKKKGRRRTNLPPLLDKGELESYTERHPINGVKVFTIGE